MPAKYSHTKKRPPGSAKKTSSTHSKDHRRPNLHVDRNITQAMSAVSKLERTIAEVLLIRFEQDIARLFSTHLYCVALLHLPTFVMRCITVGGPGWIAANADCDEIKDFFRSIIGMDLRQAGERVATKSVLWSYTALRHFALSNNVQICRKRGLHSLRLLPHYDALQAHLDTLQAMPAPAFSKPPHLGPLSDGARALEEACEAKYSKTSVHGGDWDPEWRQKIRVGYERISQTLWRVAREFDVRGYGLVLREKLTAKWCECGCSTDHLSEVCEKTVREDEEESGVRPGKQREWDGRGSGVYGWETEDEEDIWDIDLDFVSVDPDECEDHSHSHIPEFDMTIGQLMEYRYFQAEREKEQGNAAYKRGEFELAIDHYKTAHMIEPEMPHYQLNMAAAYLKLHKWMDAESSCNTALSQHKSVKGHWRRSQARKNQGRIVDAVKDLRAVLRLQPSNREAQIELAALTPPEPPIDKNQNRRTPRNPQPSPSSSNRIGPSCSSSSAGSSSSRVPLVDHTTPPRKAGKQKPKGPPFPRTDADNYKLAISCLPLTVDIPAMTDLLAYAKNHTQSGQPSKGKRTSSSTFSAPKGVKTTSETFSYPSWDRYLVKKVSS
ncbi:hypothetical protein QCA50_018406 [Cerrena zonata]|uniref:RNA polymerase II-associated protein 3 n=1 Tax=Cerrena zonata TaxID=2478898 RepID=A0AAW0FK33_9APHY